ncbi:hypothetical protein HMPREF0602_0625 [Neisseria meningitidis ATCC 13091]|uniref:Uncharacterized protein n=1 Tax=Neisseria meningitidis serogroup B (strain ATCC 13091 / M2091) TaxID=862513 RepID=E0N7Z5_NEIM3|nr:hypothetical protein HMPREF0602_0625 [Neisseria meningitidis ATCC 13091]
MTHKNAPKNFQLPKTFLILSKKWEKSEKFCILKMRLSIKF